MREAGALRMSPRASDLGEKVREDFPEEGTVAVRDG